MVATAQKTKRIKVECGANFDDFEVNSAATFGDVRKELADLLNIPLDARADLLVTNPDTGEMKVTEGVNEDDLVPVDSVLAFVRPDGVGVKG